MIFFKKLKNENLDEKLSEITTELTGMNTRIDWLETKLDEIKEKQREGEKRQKYIIEKQVELHILFKKYLKWIKEDWDNKENKQDISDALIMANWDKKG